MEEEGREGEMGVGCGARRPAGARGAAPAKDGAGNNHPSRPNVRSSHYPFN